MTKIILSLFSAFIIQILSMKSFAGFAMCKDGSVCFNDKKGISSVIYQEKEVDGLYYSYFLWGQSKDSKWAIISEEWASPQPGSKAEERRFLYYRPLGLEVSRETHDSRLNDLHGTYNGDGIYEEYVYTIDKRQLALKTIEEKILSDQYLLIKSCRTYKDGVEQNDEKLVCGQYREKSTGDAVLRVVVNGEEFKHYTDVSLDSADSLEVYQGIVLYEKYIEKGAVRFAWYYQDNVTNFYSENEGKAKIYDDLRYKYTTKDNAVYTVREIVALQTLYMKDSNVGEYDLLSSEGKIKSKLYLYKGTGDYKFYLKNLSSEVIDSLGTASFLDGKLVLVAENKEGHAPTGVKKLNLDLKNNLLASADKSISLKVKKHEIYMN